MDSRGTLTPGQIAELLAARASGKSNKTLPQADETDTKILQIDSATGKILEQDYDQVDEEIIKFFTNREAKREKKRGYKVCLTCGSKFVPKRIDQKFCKSNCRDNYERAERLQALKDQGVRKCAHCGKNLPDWKKLHSKYCDTNCKYDAYKARHGIT